MPIAQYVPSQNAIQKQVYHETNQRDLTGAVAQDITELLIEQLDLDTGGVIESLVLEGTNLPHQPFMRSVRQDAVKYYYPGGPPDRRPTVQILGSMDEDVTLKGKLKATKIQGEQRRNDPTIISNIIERFTREGKPVRVQFGQWIKYAVIIQTTPQYHTDADIDYEIAFMILGDENPITGEATTRDEEVTSKVVEASDPQDLSQAVTDFIDEINRIREEEAEALGYDLDNGRGGILGFARRAAEFVSDISRQINDVIDIVDDFVREVEKTAASIQKALLEVEGIRNRIYQIQGRLFVAFQDIKRAADLDRQLQAFNVFSLLTGLANNFQNQVKIAEDAIRREQVVSIRESYVVIEGDTYQSIATKFYGSVDRWEELRDFNPGELTPDTVILIPR